MDGLPEIERDKVIRALSRYSEKCLAERLDLYFAKAVTEAIELLKAVEVKTNIFDQEELHDNCTVQILTNSVTGEVSIGWWKNVDGE